MNMQEKVLGWIGRESGMVEDNIVPPVAMLPEAKPMTDEDKRLAVIAQAHIHVEQLRQEREAYRAEIERLQAEAAELRAELKKESAGVDCSNWTSRSTSTPSPRCKPSLMIRPGSLAR